jgi:hypothetical protein
MSIGNNGLYQLYGRGRAKCQIIKIVRILLLHFKDGEADSIFPHRYVAFKVTKTITVGIQDNSGFTEQL